MRREGLGLTSFTTVNGVGLGLKLWVGGLLNGLALVVWRVRNASNF